MLKKSILAKTLIFGFFLIITLLSVKALTSFTTTDAEGVDMSPLDDDLFVISWCDDDNDKVSFAVHYTNGTVYTSATDVDSDIGMCWYMNPTSVSSLNSTSFVIAWTDDTDEDVTFAVYDINGTALTSATDINTSIGSLFPTSVSVSTFDSNSFVVGWFHYGVGPNTTYNIKTYYMNGTEISIEKRVTDRDVNTGERCEVATFNSTHFVIGWDDFSNGNSNKKFSIYDINGNLVIGDIAISEDTNQGTYSISVSTFNSTHFVAGFQNFNSTLFGDNITFGTYRVDGIAVVNNSKIDHQPIAEYAEGTVSALNSTHFVIGWFDTYLNDDIVFAIYDVDGNSVVSETIADANILDQESEARVISQESGIDIGICNDNFIIAWDNGTEGLFEAYDSDGTAWNGFCDYAPTTPIPSINSTDGSNDTNQDLHCNSTILDNNNNSMNVTVRWFEAGVQQLEVDYNNSYMNGTLFNATLASGNTTPGDTWYCSLRLFDGGLYSPWGDSNNITIPNQNPSVTLNAPVNDLKRNISWVLLNTTVYDNDLTNLTVYFFNVSEVINKSTNVLNGTTITYNWTGLANRQYNWSVKVDDSNLNVSSANRTFLIDTITPNMRSVLQYPASPTTNVDDIEFYINITDSNIDTLQITITDPVVVSYTYNVTTTTGNATNPRYYFNWSKGNLTRDGQHSYYFVVNDTCGNHNRTATYNFTSSTPSPPSGDTGGGGGGGVTVIREQATNFSFFSERMDFILAKGSTRPRTKQFYLINKDIEEIEVTLSCSTEGFNETNISICDYVTFANTSLTISPNEELDTIGIITIETPPEAQFNDEYFFNVIAIATEDSTELFAKMSVKARVPYWGLLFKWSYLPLQSVVEGKQDQRSSYPIVIVALFVGFFIFAGTFAYLRKKLALTGFTLGIVLSFISFAVILAVL